MIETIKPSFSSGLAAVLQRYVAMKRALGRQFNSATHALQSLDRLLAKDGYADLNATAFNAWCKAQEHLASGVRRVRMLEVHAFCLYRRRTEPECFLPDPQTFPPYHQRLRPHIFTESEIARLLNAASGMKGNSSTPLRPELTRLAIVLLYTTGMRRGELLNLTEGDYNRQESTLHIRRTKFYKSRLLPVHDGIANEIERYLAARAKLKLPSSATTPLMWNATQGGRAYTGTGISYCIKPLLLQCGIKAASGLSPRIHDFRHRADFPVMPTCLRLVPYSPLFGAELRVCWLVEVGIIRVVFSELALKPIKEKTNVGRVFGAARRRQTITRQPAGPAPLTVCSIPGGGRLCRCDDAGKTVVT